MEIVFPSDLKLFQNAALICTIIKHKKVCSQLTVLVHAHRHAFFESTRLALVAVGFVDDAAAGSSLASLDEKKINSN